MTFLRIHVLVSCHCVDRIPDKTDTLLTPQIYEALALMSRPLAYMRCNSHSVESKRGFSQRSSYKNVEVSGCRYGRSTGPLPE